MTRLERKKKSKISHDGISRLRFTRYLSLFTLNFFLLPRIVYLLPGIFYFYLQSFFTTFRLPFNRYFLLLPWILFNTFRLPFNRYFFTFNLNPFYHVSFTFYQVFFTFTLNPFLPRIIYVLPGIFYFYLESFFTTYHLRFTRYFYQVLINIILINQTTR